MANKFNPVGWFEIYVNDMDRATKFYETVLNIKLTNMSNPGDTGNSNMVMKSFPGEMDNPGSAGALVKMEGMKGGGSNVIIYFICNDCAVEEKRAEAAGGKVCQSKMSIGEYGFISLVSDTEGNMIGLHSMK